MKTSETFQIVAKQLTLIISILLYCTCSLPEKNVLSEQEVTLEWAKLTLYITKNTPANSPPYASRAFGYIGLTMYESIVKGYPDHNSMAGQLNGLDELPLPEPNKDYNWILSLNAAQAFILKNIYNQTSDENKTKIDSLEKEIYLNYQQKSKDKEVSNRSVDYGKAVAMAIFEWSKTDGGHRGYLKNFTKDEIHPTRPGSWKPALYSQSISHHPLLSKWGQNRKFLTINGELPLPEMIPYDTVKGSPYYEEFMKVYHKERSLTQKEKQTAIWWGDDPDVTFTPPGHSYYITTLAIEQSRLSLISCAEIYAKVGMAVADAVNNCWNWKFHYFTERPNTYIPQFIDKEWVSFWPDPPFPAFPSAHSIQAAAASTLLEDMFGNPFHFTDNAHLGRERDDVRNVDFVPRSFSSFWEAAEETANSRLYGGIHTPYDNKTGLEEGLKIGENVKALNWKSKQ